MITPYKKITTSELWTDAYISKQMLKFHLQTENDIASRNIDTVKKTVEFISANLPKGYTICDYGCGPGLYTDMFQKKGYKVIGLDISKESLEYAKTQNDQVIYKEMNYIEDKVEENIDLATMIYNDFGALDPISQIEVLHNVHNSLDEHGLFFFDIYSHKYFNKVEESKEEYEETDGFYMPGKAKITKEVTKYEELKLILTHIVVEGENGEVKEFYNWDKCYSRKVMMMLLNDNGFMVRKVYSTPCGDQDFKDNDLLVFLCQKAM